MTSSGWSVAVSGNTVVAGAPNHEVGSNPGQGAAYVFVMPATGPWVNATQTAELTASDGQAGDELGWSVAVSGNTIVAGARARQIGANDDQGAAYVCTEPSGGWVTTSADTAELTASDGSTGDNLGESVAVSGTTDRRRCAPPLRELGNRRLRRRVRVRARERIDLYGWRRDFKWRRDFDRTAACRSDVHRSAGAGAGGYCQCGAGVWHCAGAAAWEHDVRVVGVVASDPVRDGDRRDPRPCDRDDRRLRTAAPRRANSSKASSC